MVKGRVKYISLLALIFGVCINANVFAVDPMDLSLTVGEVLTLSVPDQPQNISITPTAAGYYDSTNFSITSATNNITGYTLSMSVTNTNLVSNTINVVTGEPPVIPTIASSQEGITAEAFAASTDTNVLNHYGVSINNGNFNAMPSTSTSIKTTTTTNSASADTTNIALATKLDLNTVPGTYSTTINFAIVVNPLPTPPGTKGGTLDESSSHPGLNIGGSSDVSFPADSLLRAFELAYVQAGKPLYIATNDTTNYPNGWKPMQSGDTGEVRFAMQDIDMTFTENNVTHYVCEWATSSTANNSYIDEALVMDIRDGKSYWIAKLADGKCWMTQNLDINLVSDSNHPYTSNDTDLNAYNVDGYVSGYSQANGVISWVPSNATYSTSSISSDGKISDWHWDQNVPYSYDVGNWYWNGQYDGSIGYQANYNYLDLDNDGAGDKFSTNPFQNNGMHGHVGNYYNFSAAIASNNSATYNGTDGIAKNSICPQGWRLPTRITGDIENDGTFDGDVLSDAYKYTGWYNTDDILVGAPFYGVQGGHIEGSNGSGAKATLVEAGGRGIYWNSVLKGHVVDGVIARYFWFYALGINPHDNGGNGSREKALNVRCLAR